jgi:hypothetical protein
LKRPSQPPNEFPGAPKESSEVIKNAMPPDLRLELSIVIANVKEVVKLVVAFVMGSHSGMGWL